MTLTRLRVLFAAATCLTSWSMAACAQQDNSAPSGMIMSNKTLLVAQLGAEQVVTGSASKATGTGAFQLDAAGHTLGYRLTYQGLENGGAQAIALYNFGQGKEGKALYVLCGTARNPCPTGSSATISGKIEPGTGRAIDNQLVTEFDAERVYVQITSADGTPEIRGQLESNDYMTQIDNFIAELAPIGKGSKANGTAVLSKTHLPNGKVSVTYIATVAGTSDTPRGAAFAPDRTQRNKDLAVPKIKTRLSRESKSGGTLSASYETDETAADALPALSSLGAMPMPSVTNPGVVVTSTQMPDGEVYGQLQPVQ